ncbi:MAG: N-6 DNA methylase, partial [Pirellulaceae bacterium]
MSGSLTRCLPDAVRRLSAHISTAADTEQEQPLWETARDWLQAVTRRPWTVDQVIEEIAQALVCMDAYRVARGTASVPPQARLWLQENANPFWQKIYQLPVVENWLQAGRLPEYLALEHEIIGEDTLSFEDFLADYDADSRTDHGVFYTPVPVVRWMVQAVARQVQEAFPGTRGLAPGEKGSDKTQPTIDILDPAAGTGVFLVEVIQQVAGTMMESWREADLSEAAANERWNAYVCDSLLPRLTGFELMLPAALLAQWVIMHKLAETGFAFRQPGALQFHVMDTMAEPLEGVCQEPRELADYLRYLEQLRLERPFNVILGNPPFSGISMNDVSWMGRLLRGQAPTKAASPEKPLSNYYQVQGEPLGERKVWLQDDYVKFLRYCHWKIEQADYGMVGLVTNHGYLDGPSFRGLRQSLCETFTRIKILDLHGNQKKKECSPDGTPDQNVFPISSGIAVGLFFRGLETNRDPVVEHRDLWGSAAQKLAALGTDVGSSCYAALEPAPPHYFLLPHDHQLQDEYLAGFSLCDVMQERTTAAVTARDGFVVGFNEAEILERLESFRDSKVSDTE